MDRDARLNFPATERNGKHIIRVLDDFIPNEGIALEIGSGSGEHVCAFASHFTDIDWVPSDPNPAHRASIGAWIAYLGLSNVGTPLDLDVTASTWCFTGRATLLLSINVIHIAPWEATIGLFRGASQILEQDGILYMYGPYMLDGQHTAPSNAAFDQNLRSRDSSWGIRDLSEITKVAEQFGLHYVDKFAMPANNYSVIFRR